MKEGLYQIQFQTPLGRGSGVVYLRDGKLWGGDSDSYYIGSYREENGELIAHVAIDRHTANPGPSTSVLGLDKAFIRLTGKAALGAIVATGIAEEAPDVPLEAALTFISD